MRVGTKICAAAMLAALAAVMLGGCINIDLGGLTGNGRMATEERELDLTLAGVVNRTSFDIVIDPGLEGKAVIEGESNLIGRIDLNQNGEGLLTVDLKPDTNIIMHGRMTVRIPAINGGVIRTEGSGDITLKGGTLEGEAFDIGISGSGDVTLSLKARSIKASINGSGSMDLMAEADTFYAAIGGSGDMSVKGSAGQLGLSSGASGSFDGSRLAAGNADIDLSGSGDADINVSGTLTGSIRGSGDITYGGDPQSVDIDDSASGDVYAR